VKDILLRFKGVFIAIVVLALSASVTFGAQAPAAGYALGGSYEDNAGTETTGDEDTDEAGTTDETTEEEDAEAGGDNCLTDPTGLTEVELAAMSHGSIVCWAAHQTEWPAWFANHGKFVSCWAHQGKPDAPSCTEAPAADAAAATHGNGKAKGQGKGQGQSNKP
jgi:hypothetical protein